MTDIITEHYDHAPSALNFMSRAIRPMHGLPADGSLPRIMMRWAGLRIVPSEFQAFCRATGIPDNAGAQVLYPHVCGFRLQMALLTHRAYPLPIWTALQIRNRLVRHRAYDPRATFAMTTQVSGQRMVEKGVEVDLHSQLSIGSECFWESRITYFYRGRFGKRPVSTPDAAAPLQADATVVDRFQISDSRGWRFGRLTGDYNGIHLWPWYARRFGFPTAFSHPQRVTGLCLARLHGPETGAQTLDLWIKGPVFYGANVVLSAARGGDALQFGLSLEGDHRAALAGHWRSGADCLSSEK